MKAFTGAAKPRLRAEHPAPINRSAIAFCYTPALRSQRSGSSKDLFLLGCAGGWRSSILFSSTTLNLSV